MLAYRISWNVVDLDLYHQMALVREALASGHLARHDVYAFTPTLPLVVHHEWGAGALALGVASVAGAGGILLLKYVLALALGFVCVRAALRAGGDPPIVAACAVLAVLLVDHGFSPVRAQAYSFLFSAATAHAIVRDRSGDRRWIPFAIPLFVLWVNLHGGCVVGLGLFAAYEVELVVERRPAGHVALVVLALVAALAMNPFGTHYYAYLLRGLTMPRPRVSEWGSLWSAAVPAHHVAMFVLSLLVTAYGIARAQRGRAGVVIMGTLAVLAVLHQRMLEYYAIAWLVFTPALLRGTKLQRASRAVLLDRPARTLAVSALLAMVFGGMLLSRRPWRLEIPGTPLGAVGFSLLSYPVGAVNFLRAAGFQGNVMTPFEQGAYVSWKLHPKVKVSLDSRYEAAFPDDVVEDQGRFYEGTVPAEQVLRKYAPDLVLAPRYARLSMKGLPWSTVYEDEGFTLYARPGLTLPAVGKVEMRDVFP